MPSLSHDASPISTQIGDIHDMQLAHEQAILTEIYIEALLVDEGLAESISALIYNTGPGTAQLILVIKQFKGWNETEGQIEVR